MTSLNNRLKSLEQRLQQEMPQKYHFYVLEQGQIEPTSEQQAEIDVAEAEGRNIVCFRVVD